MERLGFVGRLVLPAGVRLVLYGLFIWSIIERLFLEGLNCAIENRMHVTLQSQAGDKVSVIADQAHDVVTWCRFRPQSVAL